MADFAEHAGLTHRQARRRLKRIDATHAGKLLIPSDGTNRGFSFYPAILARLEPDLFSPIESIEFRLEELEEGVGELRAHQRRIATQVGQNTRKIEQLSLFHKAG